MRRLLALALISLAATLAACGGSGNTSLQARLGASTTVEVRNLKITTKPTEAALAWEVTSTTNLLHFLVEQKLGAGSWTKYPELPAGARSEVLHNLPTGPVAFRVWAVVKQASREVSSTVPNPPAPTPVPTPEPTPPPPPAPSGYAPGLNAGYWGPTEPADLKAAKITYVRLDTPTPSGTRGPSNWESSGLKVIADMSGPYTSTGVSGVNQQTYAAADVALIKANPHLYAVETLNEPGGQWFWGSNAESSTNRTAYANLVIAVHDALVANFGAARPKQLCSYDGGHDSSNAWGEAWEQSATALADCDALTLHPYGGTGTRSTAALGNRAGVEAAEAKTHKPIDVTEVGFPTKGPTGDSLQYTEAEQASSIVGFNSWAKSKGYIELVTFYGYRDGEVGGGYGVETHEGKHKLAFGALAQAASE